MSYGYPEATAPQSDVRIIPTSHNVVGTCGKCGGPIISPMIYCSGDTATPAPEWCMDCGAKPRPEKPYPFYGPVREMES